MPRSPEATGGWILLRCARSLSSTLFMAASKFSLGLSSYFTTAWLIVIPGAMVITLRGNSATAFSHSSLVSKMYLTFPAAAMTWLFFFQPAPRRSLNARVQMKSTSSLAPTMS